MNENRQIIEPYITTATGGKFYPLGPDPDDARIEDIAHSLACCGRYNGHTSFAGEPIVYSVGQHCLLLVDDVKQRCGNLVSPETIAKMQYAALMHDAAEFCLTDIPRPLKPLIANYRLWEEQVEFVLAKKYGFIYPFPETVKTADNLIVLREIFNFYPEGSEAWKRYGIHKTDNFEPIWPLTPSAVKRQFLAKFHELRKEIGICT